MHDGLLPRMYQYSRAIYRSIKELIDPYAPLDEQLESRRAVLSACEGTMERLARDPLYFAKPDRALFQDIRRYFPITCQAQVAWAVREGVAAAVAFIEEQIDAGALDGGGDGVATERLGLRVVERAAIGLADRRAGGGDDDGFTGGHGGSFF